MKNKYWMLFILSLILVDIGFTQKLYGDPWPGDSGTVIADDSVLGSNFEPSGLAIDITDNSYIWVIDDEGWLAKIEHETGTLIDIFYIGGDLEAVTMANGMLYVLDESNNEVLEVDPSTGVIEQSWGVPVVIADSDKGLEGMVFVPDDAHPYGSTDMGGMFYLSEQGTGEIHVCVFDPDGIAGWIDTFDSGISAAVGLEYVEKIKSLVIIGEDTFVIMDIEDNTITKSYELPGSDQEGVAVLPDSSKTAQVFISEDSDNEVVKYKDFPITRLFPITYKQKTGSKSDESGKSFLKRSLL